MNQQVKRGQAPKSVDRVDTANTYGSYNFMKYFTKEYIGAELSDNEFDKRNCAYKNELLQILNMALPTVKGFIEDFNLHDGKINGIKSTKEKIEIHFEYGDNQIGYHKITVQFLDAATDYNRYIKSLLSKIKSCP